MKNTKSLKIYGLTLFITLTGISLIGCGQFSRDENPPLSISSLMSDENNSDEEETIETHYIVPKMIYQQNEEVDSLRNYYRVFKYTVTESSICHSLDEADIPSVDEMVEYQQPSIDSNGKLSDEYIFVTVKGKMTHSKDIDFNNSTFICIWADSQNEIKTTAQEMPTYTRITEATTDTKVSPQNQLDKRNHFSLTKDTEYEFYFVYIFPNGFVDSDQLFYTAGIGSYNDFPEERDEKSALSVIKLDAK